MTRWQGTPGARHSLMILPTARDAQRLARRRRDIAVGGDPAHGDAPDRGQHARVNAGVLTGW